MVGKRGKWEKGWRGLGKKEMDGWEKRRSEKGYVWGKEGRVKGWREQMARAGRVGKRGKG
jgi:hypothetical protein